MTLEKSQPHANSMSHRASVFDWHFPDSSLKIRLVLWLTKKKGKTVPLQAWSGPEGSRKLMFPDFMTTAQDGCKVVSLTHWPPLPPGNTPVTCF